MLPFFISFIVACALRRDRMWRMAGPLSLGFAVFCYLAASGHYGSSHLDSTQQGQVVFLVLFNTGLGVAEVFAAFWLS
jgi:ABC-type branched-subunit amino acid transport system permease subunit